MKKKESKFSRNLKFLRRLNGYTQNVLAIKLGINRNKISSYESGFAEPSLTTLCSISAEFGISLDDIITQALDSAEGNISVKPLSKGYLFEKTLALDLEKYIYDTNSAQKVLDGLLAFNAIKTEQQKSLLLEKYIQTLDHMLKNNWKLIGSLQES